MADVKDIATTADGDLAKVSRIDADGNTLYDLDIVTGADEVQQFINWRLKTNIGELLMHPEIGNRLQDIIGERNTRETAELGKSYLLTTITSQSMISASDVTITAVPITEYKLIYSIDIGSVPYAMVNIVLEVDLQNGIRRVK